MKQANNGDRVKINFVGKLDDGTVIDTTFAAESHDCDCDDCGCGSEEVGPMELVLGAEDFFPSIEAALVGMAVGEKKTVIIPADDAFGDYDPERVFTVERSQFSDDFELEVGQGLELTSDDGEAFEVMVVELTDDNVTLDTNHPLAGEELTYEVELLEIL